ncbi:hypothetical protein GCM10027614_80120 [Micromonospora vulcania]
MVLETAPVGVVDAGDLIHRVDVSSVPQQGLAEVIAAEAAAATDRLDPDGGLMLQAVWFDAGDLPGRLLLVAHHLAVDGVSWRTLLEDLASAAAGTPLPAVGTSLRRYAQAVQAQAQAPQRLAELEHWIQVLAPGAELLPGTVPAPATGARRHTSRLSATETRTLLTAVPTALRAEITDVLLAALHRSVTGWRGATGRDAGADLLVEVERHGREEIEPGLDLARTVGWFTAVQPVRLDGDGDNLFALVAQTGARLRAASDGGLGYGMLRHLNAQTAPILARLAAPQVLFNYYGRFPAGTGEPWTPAAEELVTEVNGGLALAHLLQVDVVCAETDRGPELVATWTWADGHLTEDDVTRFADGWAAALRELADVTGSTTSSTLLALSPDEIAHVGDLSPAPVGDIWPLSPLQEGLYFHASYDAGALDVYTGQDAFDLAYRVDVERLRRAGAALLARNDGMRAGFTSDGLSQPVQFVPDGLALRVDEVDLSDLGEAECAAAVAEVLAADRGRQFDLANPPLCRLTLIRLPGGRDRLVVSHHLILWDGWSEELFVEQLFTLYERDGDGTDLPPAGSYRDHLAWLGGQDTGSAIEHWREALAGLTEPTMLGPADRSLAPALPERHVVELPAALGDRLRDVARRHGLTLNTVFSAAWGLVLGGFAGRGDVVFGMTVAGRHGDVPLVDSIIGLFLNTVPIRVTPDPRESVLDLLLRVQEQRITLMEFDHLGLATIQQAAGHTQLFDTLYVMQNFVDETESADLRRRHGIVAVDGVDATHYPLTRHHPRQPVPGGARPPAGGRRRTGRPGPAGTPRRHPRSDGDEPGPTGRHARPAHQPRVGHAARGLEPHPAPGRHRHRRRPARRPGSPHTRSGGAGRGDPAADVRAARRAGQPPRTAAAGPGRRAGDRRGAGVAPDPGHGGRPVRGAAYGRGVPATGVGPAGRTARTAARRHRAAVRAHRRVGHSVAAAVGRSAGGAGRPGGARRTRRAHRRAARRQRDADVPARRSASSRPPGVHHLHVRVDRTAQGRGHPVPRADQHAAQPPRGDLRPGGGGGRTAAAHRPHRLVRLRHVLGGTALARRGPRGARL